MLSPVSLLVYTPKVYQRKEEYEEKKKKKNLHQRAIMNLARREQNKNTSQGLWFQSLPGKESGVTKKKAILYW